MSILVYSSSVCAFQLLELVLPLGLGYKCSHLNHGRATRRHCSCIIGSRRATSEYSPIGCGMNIEFSAFVSAICYFQRTMSDMEFRSEL